MGKQMSSTEQGVRIGVGVAHAVGTIALSMYGLGGLAPVVGNIEGAVLDSAFADSDSNSDTPSTAAPVATTPPVVDKNAHTGAAQLRATYGIG